MHKGFYFLICLLVFSAVSIAQDRQNDESPLKVGIVTPEIEVDGLVVFETFGRTSGTPLTRATVLPGRLVKKASFFASTPQHGHNGHVLATPDAVAQHHLHRNGHHWCERSRGQRARHELRLEF